MILIGEILLGEKFKIEMLCGVFDMGGLLICEVLIFLVFDFLVECFD